MWTTCVDCDKLIDARYFRCDACVLARMREANSAKVRKEVMAAAQYMRSEVSANTLALTREDRQFLSAIGIGCE